MDEDKDIELFQLTFDGAEVLYEEVVEKSRPTPPSFTTRRYSTRKPKGHPRLFEDEVDKPADPT